jgi:hypothetical protein
MRGFAMQTIRFFNNTGGMNLRTNDVTLGDGEAEEIVNLHATSRGSWSSSNVGYTHLNGSALDGGASVNSLYEYIPVRGTSIMVAASGTKLYTFEPSQGSSTQIASGLANQRMNFVTFKGLLIGCNGSDQPQKWDGTNPVADLGGWPPTVSGIATPGKPSLSEIFVNRLVFSGDANNPSMLYISELENPENFTPGTGATSAGAIQVSPGDGERITALKTLYLPAVNEEVLVVFKERSTYLLTGNDADTFALQKISDEFGAVSHQSVALVGNELMFLSQEGITSISTATAQGNLTTGFLSDRIRPQLVNLNRNMLSETFAVHLRNRQEVWWFVPDGSATQNQTVLVYNYGVNRAWSKRTGIVAASGLAMNGNLYTGNYAGIIQQQLRGNSYNGQAIQWTYRTGFHDLNSPRARKRIKDIELYLKQISNVDVTVNMYWDFRRGSGHRQTRMLSVVPDGSSSVFNVARYGQDYFNLAGSSIFKFIPAGSGRYFQLELTGNAADRPVEIEGWTITALYGGYR